jgi:hypothetical protein
MGESSPYLVTLDLYIVTADGGHPLRVARFFLVQHTKNGENIPKWPQNVRNRHNKDEVAVK